MGEPGVDEKGFPIDLVRPPISDKQLKNRFLYHPPPNQARVDAHAAVSNRCYELAIWLRDTLPEGRNLSIALTRLEDVRMRANAALACDSDEYELAPDGSPRAKSEKSDG